MTRQAKYALWFLGTALACFAGYVGFWLEFMNDYSKGVLWETEDGGLWMHYFPISPPDIVTIRVRKTYAPGTPRNWQMVRAGPTDRWILPLHVPPLEEQFARAGFDSSYSDLESAIRFYAEATQRQRDDIVRAIEATCSTPSHNGFTAGEFPQPLAPAAAGRIIHDAFATGQYPWLEPLLAECTATPTAPPAGGDIPGDRIKNDVVPDP